MKLLAPLIGLLICAGGIHASAHEADDEMIYELLDSCENVVLVERELDSSNTKTYEYKIKSQELIQGIVWYEDGKNDKLDKQSLLRRIELEDQDRVICVQEEENGSFFQTWIIHKETAFTGFGNFPLKRLRELAKQPFTPMAERVKNFLAAWTDIAMVECDQEKGVIVEYQPLKGSYFDSIKNARSHQKLLLFDEFKNAPENYARAVIFGNPAAKDSPMQVAWIIRDRVLFPGRNDFRLDDLLVATKPQ